jgi:hypothetical protein
VKLKIVSGQANSYCEIAQRPNKLPLQERLLQNRRAEKLMYTALPQANGELMVLVSALSGEMYLVMPRDVQGQRANGLMEVEVFRDFHTLKS